MSLSLPHKLAVATAAMLGALEAIGIVLYARSYVDVMASGVVVENWSVFLVQFLINVVALVFSAIGFFGGLYGPSSRRRLCAFVFAIGSVSLLVLRWVAVGLGILQFHGPLSLLPPSLGLIWFGGLANALRPNYSLKRTAADGLR